MSNIEKKEKNLNQLIDKLNSLSLSYSQPNYEIEKIRTEKNELSRKKNEIEKKNQELMREHKYLKEKIKNLQLEVSCDHYGEKLKWIRYPIDVDTFEENLYYNLPVTYEVGDLMFGGVITSIDGSGYHGRVAVEPAYYSAPMYWSTDLSNTTSYDPEHTSPHSQDYDGRNNTIRILDFYIDSDESPLAAEYASNLNINGYDDWYLPSKAELDLIYTNKSTIDITATVGSNGGAYFLNGVYLSSTEDNATLA